MQTEKQQDQNNDAATGADRLTLDLWPDVGRALGLGRNSTFKAAKSGEIPTIRIGKRLLVSKAKLDQLLGRQKS